MKRGQIMKSKKIILVIFTVFAVLLSSQCTLKKGNDAMVAEKSKATVLRFVDKVQNQHEIGALDELFSPDFVDHSGISTKPNLDGTKQFFTTFFTAFPDIQVTIHDQVVEGDKVWMRKKFKGTHQGEFMGLPPTGKPVKINVIDIHRVVDGKIIEHWRNRCARNTIFPWANFVQAAAEGMWRRPVARYPG
jgi:predicted ester cyclase